MFFSKLKDNPRAHLIGYRNSLRAHSTLIVLGLAIFTLVTAFLGTLIAARTVADPDPNPNAIPLAPSFLNRVTDSFYEAAQSVLLNMEPHVDSFNWLIGLARVSAVLLATLVATKAIGRLFKESTASVRLQLSGKRNVLVCGLGRIGSHVVRDVLESEKLVIVQEITAPNRWTALAERQGAVVTAGDVNDIESLRDHVNRDPRAIYLVSGDDHANISALANVRALRKRYVDLHGKPLGPVEFYVHISDPKLERTFRRCVIDSHRRDPEMNVRPFNIFHETACQLIVDQLTPLRPSQREQVALYILFGFGQMGKAMVTELVEYAHFENQKRSRILVITPNAGTECDDFLVQWGRLSPRVVHSQLADAHFDPACDEWSSQAARPLPPYQIDNPNAVEYAANVHFCELNSADALSLAEAGHIARLIREPGVTPVALFCFDNDESNFRLASELNDTLQDFHDVNVDVRTASAAGSASTSSPETSTESPETRLPIFTFLPRSPALRDLVSNSADRFYVTAFGDVAEGVTRAQDQLLEQIAADLAWSYETLRNPSLTYEQFLQQWRQKEYWQHHTNLAAAEHARIKVQLLGYRFLANQPNVTQSGRFANLDEITTEQKAMLGIIEHNRWMAERLMLGWSYGERCERPPRRPSMCAKEVLHGEELEKDFDQIKALLKHFQKFGFELVKQENS